MLSVDLNTTKRQYKISVDSQLAIIESWMTSLKKHTIDYNENTFLNVKNIPSRYTSWCGSELIDEMGILNNNNNNNNNNSNNNYLSVVNYRKNDQLIEDNVTTKRLCQFFNISVNDNNAYQLKTDHVNSKIDNNNKNNNNNNSNNNILFLYNQNYCNQKFDLKICLYNTCLSFSLNPIIISYDDKLKFLINNRVKYNITEPKRLVQKYFQLIKYIDNKNRHNNNNNNNNNNNSNRDGDRNKKINYFIKNTIENYSLNCKKNILDYEIKCVKINNVTDANLTIDDFVIKTDCDYLKNKKNFSDFCVTAGDTSDSAKSEMDNCDRSGVAEKPDDNRVLRRDTVTKNRIKNLNVYRNAMGHQEVNDNLYNLENDEDDYIYQPIWKFHTIGNSPDNDETSSIQANLATPDDISDSDNWSNAEQDFAFQNFCFIDENDNSLEYIDASSVDKQPGHINNDSNNNNNNNNNSNCDEKIVSSPYSKVTIFYSLTDHLLNEIKYSKHNNRLNINEQMNIRRNEKIYNKYHNLTTNSYNKTLKNILNSNLPKNLENWQLSLLNYNLIEDEEDVIMTERSVTESASQDHTSKIGKDVLGKLTTSFTEPKIFGFVSSKSTSVPGFDSPPEGKFTPNRFADEFEYVKNDNESETTSLKSLNASLKDSPKYSPTNSEKKLDKIKAKEKERKKEKDKVFGVDLDKVELDLDLRVPKFIVECIKIVEEDENIETNGIYRASGNKNNIENIKKKMNEKRYMSKESKYMFLQNQDLHTITGALKLFFRETSDLIPEDVFKNLPKNLSCKENLETVKTQINTLDEVRFETLKYLMKHLRKVHENNSKNLMTSSNLSIIWGASLFTKSVNSILSLIENDIMNRNVLIRVLIDNYDYVFNENMFSSHNDSPPNNNNTIHNNVQS